MKLKSLQRLPVKLVSNLPIIGPKTLVHLFNRSGFQGKHKLWDLAASKPPIIQITDTFEVKANPLLTYKIALEHSTFREDWALLWSLGHDAEIKAYYVNRIIENPPTQFLDIGANFGLHSILFGSADIPVHAFEPNPYCCRKIQSLCQLNGLTNGEIQLHQYGVSDREQAMTLTYPADETWLGSLSDCSINPEESCRDNDNFRRNVVKVKTIDSLNDIQHRPDALWKIDVEGHEELVIRGAIRTIQEFRPTLILEHRPSDSESSQLPEILNSIHYDVRPLILPFSKKVTNILATPQS